MAFDLLLDQDTNDLVISDKEFQFTTKVEQELGQRIGIHLRTFETEWFIDQTYGTPYLQKIIGQARKKTDVDTIMISEIKEEEGVKSVSSFSSTWDKLQRIYSFTADVLTDGGEITISILNKPAEEWIYPDNGEDNSRTDCDLSNVEESANKLYYFINYQGLPDRTYATWINQWT